MHYDFKKKLNKIDSQQYKNFQIPEIDWSLNEAQELFVKLKAKPGTYNVLGFESSQESIDDIRTVVIDDYCSPIINKNLILPENYWYYLSGRTTMDKGSCKDIKSNLVFIRSHEEEFEESSFDNSSFEWREVNAVFHKEGLRFFDDGTFTNKTFCMSYIKKLKYIHNAEDFRGGTYKLPSGEALVGHVDSELPLHTHGQIVDLAVLIATGEMQMPDYQIKQAKVNLNQL